jgi:hypothetical protein
MLAHNDTCLAYFPSTLRAYVAQERTTRSAAGRCAMTMCSVVSVSHGSDRAGGLAAGYGSAKGIGGGGIVFQVPVLMVGPGILGLVEPESRSLIWLSLSEVVPTATSAISSGKLVSCRISSMVGPNTVLKVSLAV